MSILWNFIVGAVCIGFGILLGAVGYATLQKKEAATVMELTRWAQDLRAALSTDAESAKQRVRLIINEIEKKF